MSYFDDKLPENLEDYEITLGEITNKVMSFEFKVANETIANDLRKVLQYNIPIMAISRITINDNTSSLNDIDLAMKLGLIPIKVNPDLFIPRKEGIEGYNSNDTLKLKLKVSCPKNSSELLNVTSKYIKWIPMEGQEEINFELVSEDIEIIDLKPGTNVDIEMFCFKNIGQKHVKYSPVEFVTFHKIKSIILKREIVGEEADKLAEILSGVVDVKQIGDKRIAYVVDNPVDFDVDIISNHKVFEDAIEIVDKPNTYFFKIESIGCFTAFNILERALDFFQK